VLAVGVGFGMAGLRPVPVIVMAQALNGALLPFVAVFLLLLVNDRRLMGARGRNGPVGNLLLLVAVAVTLVLGLASLARAASSAIGIPRPGESILIGGSALLAAGCVLPLWRAVRRRRG